MPELIKVHPQETLADLLAEIGRRLESTADGTLLLWAPRGTLLLRQMEDYQALREALRRHGTRLKILSPDARIVGMALVFGLEAEITLHPPESTSPPPEVRAGLAAGAEGAAPEPAPVPAHATVDLSALPQSANMAQQTLALSSQDGDLPAVDPGILPFQLEGAAPGAPAPERTSNWLHLDEDDAPAVSFAQWLAMQAAGTSGVPPADLDLSHLPPWLQATLAAGPPRPPAAPAPARKPFQPTPAAGGEPPPSTPPALLAPAAPPAPVPHSTILRCPHCGGELDKEEMLRLLAELWGQ